MTIDPSSIRVENNPEKKRFEFILDGQVAKSEYMLVGDRIIFTHTEVPEAFEGNGIAGRLARAGLDHAREQGLKVMPLCPFVAGYIKRHPEYKDLLLAGFHVD